MWLGAGRSHLVQLLSWEEDDAEVIPVRIFAVHLQHKAFVDLFAERLAPCDQVPDPVAFSVSLPSDPGKTSLQMLLRMMSISPFLTPESPNSCVWVGFEYGRGWVSS